MCLHAVAKKRTMLFMMDKGVACVAIGDPESELSDVKYKNVQIS